MSLRERMVAACRRMAALGLSPGTSGNLSARDGDGVLVTPSSMPYAAMGPGDIVALDWEGRPRGPGRPSSEWRLHRDLLRARPEAGAVLHCHSPHATALACHHRAIPAFHYAVALMGGDDIRCAPYATFGTQELSDAALAAMVGRRACLLGQHGQVALGATPEAALGMAVEVEALARLYLGALALGEPPVLPPEEMARVRGRIARMGYGLSPDP